MMNRHLLIFFFVFSSLLSCDFENKIRRLASDPSGRKRDSLKQDEVSSNLAESEPNTVLSKASEISLTKELREISGELSGADFTDWFNIKVPESGFYEITVTPTSTLDISLFLDKSNYAFDLSGAGGSESIKSTDTNHIRFAVKRERKTEGSYKIKIAKFELRKNSELEPNNTAKTANAFHLKEGMVGKIDQLGDRDVFKIIASQSDLWELYLIKTKEDRLTLKFCEDVELVSCSRIYQINDGTLHIPSFGLPSKKMPLYAVVGSGKTSSRYQLLAHPIFVEPDAGLREFEPNDSFPMEIDSKISSNFLQGYLKDESDVDRFKILKWEYFYYSVFLDDPNLSLVVEGQKVDVRNPFHSCMKKTDDSIVIKFGTRKNRPTFQGHDYHINLFQKDEGFELEPNNTKEVAQLIQRTTRGDASLNDPDYFVFEVQEEKLEYGFSNLSNNDIYVSISDDEGFDVLASQTVRRDKPLKLKFDFPKGKYFVKIVGQSKACSPYQLSNTLLL